MRHRSPNFRMLNLTPSALINAPSSMGVLDRGCISMSLLAILYPQAHDSLSMIEETDSYPTIIGVETGL